MPKSPRRGAFGCPLAREARPSTRFAYAQWADCRKRCASRAKLGRLVHFTLGFIKATLPLNQSGEEFATI